MHSLEVREPIRRYEPKYTLVIVSSDEYIRHTVKYKVVPPFSEIGEVLNQFKGCKAFVASAEMYPKLEELEERVSALQNEL